MLTGFCPQNHQCETQVVFDGLLVQAAQTEGLSSIGERRGAARIIIRMRCEECCREYGPGFWQATLNNLGVGWAVHWFPEPVKKA